MSKKGPGQHERNGISIFELFEMFLDEKSARQWFENIRWGDSRYCGHCGSTNTKPVRNEKPMPYWCTDCRSYFSVKTGTPMQSSKLPLRKWVFGMYLMTTSLKGVSSLKLHRDLGITQKSAWFMSQRIRESWNIPDVELSGIVEVDETYIGGLEKNKHESKKLHSGRGGTGKAIVVGVKERDSKKVIAEVIDDTKRKTLHGFINENVESGSTV